MTKFSRWALFGLLMGLMTLSYAARSGHVSHHTAIKRSTRAVAMKTYDNQASININKADAKQLSSIKGIGEKRAKAIVDYRVAHGDFHSIEDLAKVKGIGLKRLTAMRDHITL